MRRIQSAAYAMGVVAIVASAQPHSGAASPTPEAARPVDFIANRGQWDRRIDFAVRTGSTSATIAGTTLTISDDRAPDARVALTFEGASTEASPAGVGVRATRYNFYLGTDSTRWRADVPVFAAIAYRDLYPGIDARLQDRSGQLEYELRVAAGAAIETVRVHAQGASDLRIDSDGSLVFEAGGATLRQSPPISWEELPDGTRLPLASRFHIIDAQRYGFAIDGRNPARPLVVDPGLVWSTFLGGSASDFIGPAAVARDGTGDVFVGGTMISGDFPSFADPGFAAGTQSPAFVARLDSTGRALRYATFIGGWHAQLVHRGLAVDAGGNAVLVGQTFSPDFPTTPGAFDRTGVNKDAFVVRLNATGGLLFSTLLGGSGEDDASAVGYDPAGNIIVGGTTASRDFPTTPTAFRPTYNTPNAAADGGADGDMFVARLTADGTALTYGTFLGGPQADVLEDLVVDANGFVTVCGWVTGNNVQVFVTTVDAFDRTWNGSQDAAIARLKLEGAGAADLKYATLIGGSSQDNLWKAAIDPGNPELVTFAGRSWSNNYPVTAGVVRPTNPPFSALFPDVEAGIVTRFRFPAAGGGSLVWSTYHHADRITGLAVNSGGEPIVAGPSAAWDLPTTRGAFVRTADGSGATASGFVTRMSADATQYLYQSFFGGSGGIADNFQSVPQVAYVSGNTVVVSGQTTSNDFPITAAAFDPTSSNAIGGGASNEGFVTKIALDADASGDLTADPPTPALPADGATFHNGLIGRLEWNGVVDPSGVHAYEFQLSTRSDFAKSFLVFRGAVADTSVVIPPSVGNSGGLCTCTFFWRVRTADGAGNVSAWSTARTFTISQASGQPTISGIDVDSATVTGGSAATGMVHLYEAAPAGGLIAKLTAHHDRSQGLDRTRALPVPVVVPDAVNIPAGALSAAFPITTASVSTAMGVSLVGTINGVGGSGAITVAPPGAPAPIDLIIQPGSVTGGTPATAILTLNQAAPAGGTVVTLSSTHPAIANVPASVTVPDGARTVSFPVTTFASLTTDVDVLVFATSGGATSNRPFFVRPPNRLPKLTAMTLSPSSVAGGSNSGGTLTFSGPIPTGVWPAQPDAVVRFSSSDPAVAALFPGDDLVPAGSTSHAFRIFTRGVPTARSVTLTAYFDGTALSSALTVGAVTGVSVSSLGANVTTLRGGEGGVATVALAAAAPAPVVVTLSTNHPELFSSLPPTVTVFTGSTTASFAFVTSQSVSTTTAVSLSAAYGASGASLGMTVSPPASSMPPLVNVVLSPASVTGGATSTGTVTLQSAAPSGGAPVQLFSSSAAATIPSTVTVPAGAASATFPIATSTVTADMAVTITGLLRLSAATSLSVKAGAAPPPSPALSTVGLSPTSVTGGTSSQGTVTLTSAAPASGMVVSLGSSNTAVATVPASVTVGGGATKATFAVATAAVNGTTGVTITGTGGGATKTASLTVTPVSQPPGSAVTLTVTAKGRSGTSIRSNPAGINVAVGSTGSAAFASGTSITLSVANGRDAIWSGACSSGGNKTKTCTFTIAAAAAVTANVQ